MAVETGIESSNPRRESLPSSEKGRIAQRFSLAGPHLLLTQVVLRDGTDGHQELVSEREWLLHPSETKLCLKGNLFAVEDRATGKGRLMILAAPLPRARYEMSAADLLVCREGENRFVFSLTGEKGTDTFRGGWHILDYRGSLPGRLEVLQNWQQSLRPSADSHRIPRFLSNTWGDRSRDSRINEAFLDSELEAAEKLGVEVFQLDDGWQKGITSNSAQAKAKDGVWSGFWNRDPDFWAANPERLPHGLEPITTKARCRGMEIGLWFNPDSWNDYANWKKDAALILNLHKKYGIRFFKIDGVTAGTSLAQENLAAFFNRVRKEAAGNIVFDLDITAGIRPGYWGAADVGPLFVENRYTDWHNYWPHQTLRNLWSLSRWIDPRRLRMEFLNNRRNREMYAHDPLAPDQYRPDTLFAIVMAANPLGWFEVSGLPQDYIDTAAPLISLWKEHRDALFSRTIIPVGHKPDGWSPTGFLFSPTDREECFLLVFRELHSKKDFCLSCGDVREDRDCFSWEMLHASHPEASLSGPLEHLNLTIPDKLGFLFARGNIN